MGGKSNKKGLQLRIIKIETLKHLLVFSMFTVYVDGLMGLKEPLQRMKNIARSSQSQAHLSWGFDLEPTGDGKDVAKQGRD